MPVKDFAGRERELETLGKYLKGARAGRATYVFISGESGIGKSWLAEEFTARLGKNANVLRHKNTPGERSVPFAALRKVMEQCKKARIGDRNQLANLLDILDAKSIGKGDLRKERDVLQSGVLEFFHGASKETPLVVSLGEVQWLDESSVALLQRMATDLKKSRLLLIGTYCPDELEDSAGNALPFTEALASMLVEGLVAMMPLERLSEAETGALVAKRAGLKRPDPKLTRLVFAESEGLPLFTIEIIDSLLESGAMDNKGAVRDLDAAILKLPKGVNDAIWQRLESLSPEVRDVVMHAAVLGNEFGAQVLLRALDIPSLVAISALAELVSRKFIFEITGADEERYVFAHSKVQQVAYASLGKSASAMHLKAARALLAIYPDIPEWVAYELVSHFSKAGEHAQTARYARKAASFATNAHAIEEALRYFDLALDSLSKSEPSRELDRSEAETRIELAAVQYSTGEWEAASESYKLAFEIGERVADSVLMTRSSIGLGDLLAFKGEYAPAKVSFTRALDLADGGDDEFAMARALKGLGYVEWRSGRLDSAEEMYSKAYEMAKRIGGDSLLGVITLEKGNVRTGRGDLRGAEGSYREAIVFLERCGDVFNLARAYNNLGDVFMQRHDWDAAISNLEMCESIARSHGIQDLLGWSLFNLGETHAKKGELGKAERACEEALEMLSRLDDKVGIAGIHKNLGIIHSLKSDWEKSDQHFAESARREKEMNTPQTLAETYIEWGAALKRKGDGDGARKMLGDALEIAERIDAKEFARRAREALESLR